MDNRTEQKKQGGGYYRDIYEGTTTIYPTVYNDPDVRGDRSSEWEISRLDEEMNRQIGICKEKNKWNYKTNQMIRGGHWDNENQCVVFDKKPPTMEELVTRLEEAEKKITELESRKQKRKGSN